MIIYVLTVYFPFVCLLVSLIYHSLAFLRRKETNSNLFTFSRVVCVCVCGSPRDSCRKKQPERGDGIHCTFVCFPLCVHGSRWLGRLSLFFIFVSCCCCCVLNCVRCSCFVFYSTATIPAAAAAAVFLYLFMKHVCVSLPVQLLLSAACERAGA